jgi:putative hydrolase of the HAD superfamily
MPNILTDIQAVIFDLDDTLYPEKTYTFSGYRAVAAAYAQHLGHTAKTVARMQALFDSPDRNRVFNVILEEANLKNNEITVTKMVETFRDHTPTIVPFPDAERALKLTRKKHKTGIISDGFLMAQSRKVEALDLRRRVDEVILTDELGPDREFWKPHTRAFEEMAARLNVPNENCIYISDNAAKDFIATNQLGWKSAHILRPGAVYADRTPPKNGQPTITAQSLDELFFSNLK